jgi:hypothetical protein
MEVRRWHLADRHGYACRKAMDEGGKLGYIREPWTLSSQVATDLAQAMTAVDRGDAVLTRLRLTPNYAKSMLEAKPTAR